MRRGIHFLFILLFGLSVPDARTQIYAAMDEYEVKAAFLYNFSKFVEWPAEVLQNSTTPFIIGVLGTDPFSGILDRVVGSKRIMGKKMEVRRFKNLQDLIYCHLLFISNSEKTNLSFIFQGTKGTSTLTVGEMDGFVDGGGMIQFVVIDKRVRFSINAGAAEDAGLRLSSKLLNLGVDLRKKPLNGN